MKTRHALGYPRMGQGMTGVPREGTSWGRRTHAVAPPGCRGPWDMASLGGTWNGGRQRSGGPARHPDGNPRPVPRAPGGGGGGGGSRGGKSWGRRPRDPLLRDRVLEAAPRAPQPPPRAGPDFPALFTSEKLSRDLGCGVAPTKRPRPPRPYANEAKHNAPIGQGR